MGSVTGLAAAWARPPSGPVTGLGDSGPASRHPGFPASSIPLFPRSRSGEAQEQARNIYRIYTRVRLNRSRLFDSMFTYVMVGLVRCGKEVNPNVGGTPRRESGRRAIP